MKSIKFFRKTAGIAVVSLFILMMLAAPIQSTPASTTNWNRPTVMIDVAKAGTSSYNKASLYSKLSDLLVVWGFNVVWNTNNLTSSSLNGVDYLFVPQATFNYTTAELGFITTWFDTGNKGIWVAGDSDFGGKGYWAYRANQVLNATGSSIYVEGGAVESDNNFGASYRVSATVYNDQDPNAQLITSGLPYQGTDAMASFHGPTAVIGKYNNGTYTDLETNSLPNVEWVVRATNATFLPNTVASDSEGAQVHANNQVGDFTLMALQHSAGGNSSGKVVVSGSHIFSTYKNQFNDPGEFETPQNDFYLVYNTLRWFLAPNQISTLPTVMIDVAKAGTSSYNKVDLYSKLSDQLKHWGFNVVWNTNNLTSTSLNGVDILIVPQATFNYTTAELGFITTWFDTGNKGIWVAGDSDFGGKGYWAYRANQVLNATGSNVYVEGGAVESDYNFGATYRVSATVYNDQDPNALYLTSGLPYQGTDAMASFHGPTAVIGKYNNGTYTDLESNSLPNVEWVVQAANATFLPNTVASDSEGAQVHTNNQVGNFTLMALQHSAGGASSGKIVVSGSHIFSTYKNQFNDPGEFETPQNDFYLVYNTLHWLSGGSYQAKMDNTVMIDVSKAGTSSYNKAGLYTAFKDKLANWGYHVIWNTDNLTSTSLNNVDLLIVPQATFNYSTAELGYITTWVDSGNKGLWVAGDSDFGGKGYWAYRANQVLTAAGSSIFVEGGAVESDYNFGATYRVSATMYNTDNATAKLLTDHLPLTGADAMASFHGPTAVIGKNSTGDFVDLETNSLTNVEWVVKAANATFLPNTNVNDTEGAQVHANNQAGEFVLMALQHSVGGSSTSKVIVSGSHIFSTYKNQFNPIGEFDTPHNDYFLVRAAMQWFAPILSTPVAPHVAITSPTLNDKFAGSFTVDWTTNEFHAATYEFDVVVDGAVVGTTVAQSYTLDLASGTHDIEIVETTWDGFVSRSAPVSVTVDKNAPSITFTSSVTNGSTITTGSMDLTFNISDSGVGLGSYTVWLDSTQKATGTSANATGSLSFTGLTNGTYTVKVTASDSLGNSVTEVYTFTVSIPAPPSTTTPSSTTTTAVTTTSPPPTSSAAGTTTTEPTNSPGFELIVALMGISTIFVVVRRRRNH